MSEVEKPKEFEPIESSQEILRLLAEGAKTLSSALIWTNNQEILLRAQLVLFSNVDKALYTSIPKDFQVSQLMDTLAKNKTDECFFNLSLPQANIFFKTSFKDYDSAAIRFTLPEKAFKVQRRQNIRYQIPDGHVLRVDFQDPLFPETVHNKKVVDISAGGLSFEVEEKDLSLFPAGLVLKGLSFTVKGRTVYVEAEVRHQKKSPGKNEPKNAKVGVQFKNISAKDVDCIASYVFEESRKFYSKFL